MNPRPSHEELQEMLPAAALEILESEDLQQVLAHIRICSDCIQQLDEYRKVAAKLALQLPPQAMDRDRAVTLRTRLLSRVRGDVSAELARPGPVVVPGSARAVSLADRWTGWMVAAGLAGLLLMHHAFHRPLSYGWLVAGALTLCLVALGVYARIQRARVAALRDRLATLEGGKSVPR